MNPVKLIALALVTAAWCAASERAAGQVWIDASQMDKWPDWVDPAYRTPIRPAPPVVAPPPVVIVPPVPPDRWEWVRVWIPPVTRTITEQVWIEGRYEWRQIVSWDDCGREAIRYERVWVPGHYEPRTREIIITPGRWEWVRRSVVW